MATHRDLILSHRNAYRTSERTNIPPDTICKRLQIQGRSIDLMIPTRSRLVPEDQDPRLLEGCLHPNNWGLHYDPLDYADPEPLLGTFPVPSVPLCQRFAAEISVLRDIMAAYHDADLYLFDRPDYTSGYGRFILNGYIFGARQILRQHVSLLSAEDNAFLQTVALMSPKYTA